MMLIVPHISFQMYQKTLGFETPCIDVLLDSKSQSENTTNHILQLRYESPWKVKTR
jgi:hypothetical protein